MAASGNASAANARRESESGESAAMCESADRDSRSVAAMPERVPYKDRVKRDSPTRHVTVSGL